MTTPATNNVVDIVDRENDDLGGAKNKSPSESDAAAARLTNEEIAKDKLGRKMAVVLASGMGFIAFLCISFALYTGYHFLDKLDEASRQADIQRTAIVLVQEVLKSQIAPAALNGSSGVPSSAPSVSVPSAPRSMESIQLLAPLIPATFSSALGLIILVTLTRFISNFVLTDKKNPPKDQDYSAISVLVKEIGSVVNTLKGKGDK